MNPPFNFLVKGGWNTIMNILQERFNCRSEGLLFNLRILCFISRAILWTSPLFVSLHFRHFGVKYRSRSRRALQQARCVYHSTVPAGKKLPLIVLFKRIESFANCMDLNLLYNAVQINILSAFPNLHFVLTNSYISFYNVIIQIILSYLSGTPNVLANWNFRINFLQVLG